MVRRVPGGEEVVRLVARCREVIADRHRVVARGQLLEREPKRDDAALRVACVVAVEVAVLPASRERRPLVEIDADARRARGTGSRQQRHGRQHRDTGRNPPSCPSCSIEVPHGHHPQSVWRRLCARRGSRWIEARLGSRPPQTAAIPTGSAPVARIAVLGGTGSVRDPSYSNDGSRRSSKKGS
jgi:hypothetical protein